MGLFKKHSSEVSLNRRLSGYFFIGSAILLAAPLFLLISSLLKSFIVQDEWAFRKSPWARILEVLAQISFWSVLVGVPLLIAAIVLLRDGSKQAEPLALRDGKIVISKLDKTQKTLRTIGLVYGLLPVSAILGSIGSYGSSLDDYDNPLIKVLTFVRLCLLGVGFAGIVLVIPGIVLGLSDLGIAVFKGIRRVLRKNPLAKVTTFSVRRTIAFAFVTVPVLGWLGRLVMWSLGVEFWYNTWDGPWGQWGNMISSLAIAGLFLLVPAVGLVIVDIVRWIKRRIKRSANA